MRARYAALFFIIFTFVWGAPARADSTIPTCDVLNTSIETVNNSYSAAYCGSAFTDGSYAALSDQATLYGIELNVATSTGGIQNFYFSTLSGNNFVGQSANHIYEPVDFTGIDTGLHTFTLPTPLTFTAGDAPHFILFGNPYYITPTSFMYGSDVSSGQQAVFYQKWFWTPTLDDSVVSDSPATTTPPAATSTAPTYSNVLFLPGIEGSRLYEGTGCGNDAEEKLWEPIDAGVMFGSGDEKTQKLALDSNGESACDDIYAKDGDVIDSVGGSDMYKSFIDEMNGMKSDGTINDWKPVAYDWRLSLDDLLANGAERDGNIYYGEATDTPYIEQTLRSLAATSKTGKVTIVAHSNGGLVAKALLNKLGASDAAGLVDKVIMVASPESGAPADVGSLLVGYGAGIYQHGYPIVSDTVAQALAQNSPMAYHLLPSEDYLESTAGDSAHPVIRFSGAAYAAEEAAYGNTIGNREALDDFLRASSLNSPLIDYANREHDALDGWAPPAGIEVDQIAGWGIDTVAGIDFDTLPPLSVLSIFEPVRSYDPIFTEDGDGTVTVPSALQMASSTDVKRYWINLHSYNKDLHAKISHGDILEVPQLGDFIKNIIENSTSTLPTYISTSQPPPNTESKELTFFLHSPLTLQLTDSLGNVTGLAPDGSMSESIPGSTYGEFGEVKYITVSEGGSYQLAMHGQASGTFSLDIQETSGGIITASSTIAGVPTTASTLASLNIANGLDTVSPLSVDENGNGTSIITMTPEAGEIVSYTPPHHGAGHTNPVSTANAEFLATTTANIVPATSAGNPMATGTQTIIPEPTATDSTISPQASTPEIAISTRIVSTQKKSNKRKLLATTRGANQNIPQTASVYGASQQPFFARLGRAVYNGLHGFWSALRKFF